MAQEWAGQIWRTVKQHKWKTALLGSVVAGVSWWLVDGKQRVTSALTSYLLKKTLKLDNLQEMLQEGADGDGSALDGAGFLGQAKNLFGSAFDQPNFSVEYFSSNQSVADNTLVSFLPILQRKIKAECKVEELLSKIRLASSKKLKKNVENTENSSSDQNITSTNNTNANETDPPKSEGSSSTEQSNNENESSNTNDTHKQHENADTNTGDTNVPAQTSSEPVEGEKNDAANEAKNTEEEKMRLWEELKIASFLQLVVSLYAPVLICLLLRVQVNLVARYAMAEQETSRVESMARRGLTQRTGVDVNTPQHTPLLPPAAQSRYVAVGQWALTHGLTQLIDKLRPHVTRVVKDIPLTRVMAAEHVTGLLLDIQRSVEQECWIGALVGVLLPREDESAVVVDEDEDEDLDENQAYRLLINETCDIIESRPFSDLATKLMTQSLTLLSEDLLLYFDQARVSQLALAKLVPIITKQSAVLLALEQHSRDTVVQSLSFSKDLNDYCFFLFKGPQHEAHPLSKSPLPRHM